MKENLKLIKRGCESLSGWAVATAAAAHRLELAIDHGDEEVANDSLTHLVMSKHPPALLLADLFHLIGLVEGIARVPVKVPKPKVEEVKPDNVHVLFITGDEDAPDTPPGGQSA